MTSPATGPSVAVFGSGAWGMNHVRTWHSLGHLAVVCDSNPARLEAVRDAYPDVKTSSSPEEVLARDDIDAVVVATPAVTHAQVALDAIAAGKHVLVEKPLATTIADAEQVLAAATTAGRKLMVGHVLEYHPAVLKLRELIREGVLGKVLYLYSHRLNFGRMRTEENALWSFAPHDLALCLRFLGSEPVEVACRGVEHLSPGVADLTTTSLRFANGVQGHIFVSWIHPFKEHRFIVVGDKQMAVFDDTAPWGEKLVRYPHEVEWLEGRVPVARKAEGIPVALKEAEPLRTECEHFAESIASNTPVLTDGSSALKVLRILDAGETSLRKNGQPVSVGGLVDSTFVHPTATIDKGATLGEGTRVWHYSHVMPGAVIGERCSFGQNVFVGTNVRVGNDVKVQNNVSLYTGVELEDGVFCGPSAVFTNVINPRSEVERKDEFRSTRVRRGATLGANCTIVCGTTIGEYGFVGAGAVVTSDVPPYALVTGVPARVTGWICACGVRLKADDGAATCAACGRRYELKGTGLTLLS